MIEECKHAKKNPDCPYLVMISESKADIEWLKKGYWIQVAFSASSFFSVIGLVVYVLTGHKVT